MNKIIIGLAALLAFSAVGTEQATLIFSVDLDATLVFKDMHRWSQAAKGLQSRHSLLFVHSGKQYRFALGSREFLASLRTLEGIANPVSVGIYSSNSDKARNAALSKQLFKLPSSPSPSVPDFIFSGDKSVVAKNNLSLQPETELFWGDEKKDLGKVPGASKSLRFLIDDRPSFALRGQEKLFIWRDPDGGDLELFRLRGVISLAFRLAEEKRISAPDAFWKLQWEQKGNQVEYRTALLHRPEVYLMGYRELLKHNPALPSILGSLDSFLATPKKTAEPEPIRVFFQDVFDSHTYIASLTGDPSLYDSAPLYLPMHRPPSHNRGEIELPTLGRAQALKSRTKDGVTLTKIAQGKRHYAFFSAAENMPAAEYVIAEQAALYRSLQARGFPVPAIVWEAPGYLLRDWIEGESAEDWVARPEKILDQDPRLLSLALLVEKSIQDKVYIEQLRPKGLVWNGKDWTLVQAKAINTGLTSEAIYQKYAERFPRRWGLNIERNTCTGQILLMATGKNK